jgi:uncharacterized protein YwqG
MNLKETIDRIKLNSIVISFDTETSKALPLGASKFGGCPDLPRGFQWYYFKGESPFTDEIKERPLSFLAQINCDEVKKYDLDNRLPSTGMLYFFYELESMAWGFDPQDKGSAKVYYYDGSISDLVKTDFPNDMEKDFKMPEIRLSFNSRNNAPSFEELFDDYQSNSWEEYDGFLEESGYMTGEENSSKLLGYSDNIQGDMLLQCELVTNGLYCGDSTGYNSLIAKELKQNKNQWKLLFQLDTVTTDNFELMFGDCGRIYYFIKEEDLKNRTFDNTCLILQCG